MVKNVRISSYIRKPSSYMTLHPIPSEFPYIWGKFCFLFISASPWTLRFFPRIWRHFCVPQTTLNLPCSPYTLKYFLCILRIRRKNEEYVERNFTFNNACGLVRMYVKKINLKKLVLMPPNLYCSSSSFFLPFCSHKQL